MEAQPRRQGRVRAGLATEGHWEAVTSTLAVEEARRNLAAKFPAAAACLEEFLRGAGRVGAPADFTGPVELPAKDRPILGAALRGGATHLLADDAKHFGEFMDAPQRTGGACILTVAASLAAAREEGSR